MKGTDYMPNRQTNHAAADSPWVTDGGMMCLKEILPKRIVTYFVNRTVNPTVPDERIAQEIPRKFGEAITTLSEIPPANWNKRNRLIPNGLDTITFDAPCYNSLASLTDEARLFGADKPRGCVFFKSGKLVAMLMGQRV